MHPLIVSHILCSHEDFFPRSSSQIMNDGAENSRKGWDRTAGDQGVGPALHSDISKIL